MANLNSCLRTMEGAAVRTKFAAKGLSSWERAGYVHSTLGAFVGALGEGGASPRLLATALESLRAIAQAKAEQQEREAQQRQLLIAVHEDEDEPDDRHNDLGDDAEQVVDDEIGDEIGGNAGDVEHENDDDDDDGHGQEAA